jgi:glycosyltransferase involved in cell wall biosynthesis
VTRILHITRDFPPRHMGGISTVVAGMAAASARAGSTVGVISFDGWRPRSQPPQRAHEHPAAIQRETDFQGAGGSRYDVVRIGSPADVDAARSFTHAFRPTLLHVHDGMLWGFAARLRGELGVRVVKSVHVLHQLQNRLRKVAENTLSLAGQQAALAGADRIIVPSEAAARALRADAPRLDGRLRTIPHGIEDTEAAREAAASRGTDRHRNPREVLYVGRFADIKGTADLFDAMPRVLDQAPEASFVIAGGVPGNRRADTLWRRRWTTNAPRHVQERTRFTGWLSPTALARHYRDAAVLVVPSRFETFGLVALEGMLHGVPVVAASAGGLAELVVDGQTGALFEPGNIEALAALLVDVLGDPARARALGQNAAREVRRTGLWDRRVQSLERVYAEVG